MRIVSCVRLALPRGAVVRMMIAALTPVVTSLPTGIPAQGVCSARAIGTSINMNDIVTTKLDTLIETLLPHGGGGTITEHRLRWALEMVAQVAWSEGETSALMALMTTEQVADQLGVSERRVRALATDRGVGWQVSRGTWLFRPGDIELLRPITRGRPHR